MCAFEIEYDTVVNKNKNIFYFINYCINPQEFKDWLIHNDITQKDFYDLSSNFQTIYIRHTRNKIVSEFNFYKSVISNIYDDNDILKIFMIFYGIYENYNYLFHEFKQMDEEIKTIVINFTENIKDMEECLKLNI